jgi:hypothetical protein
MFVLVFIARVFQTSYLIYPLAGLCLAAVAAAWRPDPVPPERPPNGRATTTDVSAPSSSVA